MQDSKVRLEDTKAESVTDLWVDTNGPFGPPEFLSSPGVRSAEQGGKAQIEGCWLHETETLEWCGLAPHHIVTGHYNTALICRKCTDLTNATCQREYNTLDYGYVDVGCWMLEEGICGRRKHDLGEAG